MIGLTAKQRNLLAFIENYCAGNLGVSPSFEEMKEASGLKSKSGVHRLIAALEERGHIRRLHGRARALEVLTPDDRLLASVSTDALHRELSRRLAA